MKKIFFPVIIFLIINFPFAFSKPIEVVCTNNSVEITIIKLPAKLVKTEGNSYSIMINNNKYIVPDFSSDLQAPLLQIPVAIPAESEIWINSDFSNFRSLGEYYQNKLFSDKQTELSHYAKIEKQGILRGVNVALLTIQPFDTDSSTNNIKIADSIRIIISFSKELQVTQYSISREESVFYDLI
ncbi:MAG: C25 family peptidase propeptide domain-containing protein, partial [Bacteroidota bacterium]